MTLNDKLLPIEKEIRSCTGCPLHKTRTNTCPGSIAPDEEGKVSIVFIGEAPGAQEDQQGKVFVGQSGQLLRALFQEVGINGFFITNTIKCRPPDNRNPDQSEIMACASYLIDQIDAVSPQVIIAIGKVAHDTLQGIFNTDMPYEIATIWHPAYVLRNGGAGSKKYQEWKYSLLRIKDKYINKGE